MAAGPDTVDGTIEDVGRELVVRGRRSEVIRPLDADQLVDSFKAYQDLLPRLLDSSDYQAAGRGKQFVKKSGWRKIATAFDLDVVRVTETVDRDDEGQPIRAMAVYRAIAPSGRTMDGDGYCSVDESRFSGPQGNQSKLENDLRATATTRAKNRAISDLVGMGEVSAEELDAGGDDTHVPATAREASDELKEVVNEMVAYLLDGDAEDIERCGDRLAAQFNGALPVAAGQAIAIIGTAVRHHAER